MFQPKEYQRLTLEKLQQYFDECVRTGNAKLAFYALTDVPYNPVKELPGLPYVCLRIPTGGGKTVVACQAVGVAARHLLRADHSVVLWLVPSDAIREQTLNALRDQRHPYRRALEATAGSVAVLDIEEALSVTRATLDTETTIIVSTMQAFRVKDKVGRKVYKEAGSLLGHFTNVDPLVLAEAERRADGSLIRSLTSVLRMRRPVVIVDEAHNARTGLSFETLARFNPSCIIEFTATPDTELSPSNVLHSVSAYELKAEDMIKLPIRLETRPVWKELIGSAVSLRAQLETLAKVEREKTGEYIRPVMLIQAQPRSQTQETLTVDVVERCLTSDFHIPPKEIRRATAEDRGLDGLDILSPTCDVRYVITVQALREGWDCPFAYILCSVAEMSASTAVEQILGRVMRLPQARKKLHPELNMAYAYAHSQNFFESARALNALTQALEKHGFNKKEAGEFIKQTRPTQAGFQFDQPAPFMDTLTVAVLETPDIKSLAPEIKTKISFDASAGMLTFKGAMNVPEREALRGCFRTAEGKAAVERIYEESRNQQESLASSARTPSERGEKFSVPALAIRQDDFFELFEDTHFLDANWSLAECDATLTEAEFPAEEFAGQRGEVDVTERGRVESRFIADLHRQTTLLAEDAPETSVIKLVNWLDHAIAHPDITQEESGVFLTKLVSRLVEERGISIEQLSRDRFRLRDAAAARINQHRDRARANGYQAMLLEDSPLVVTEEVCFSFDQMGYPCSTPCERSFEFKKHYYPQVHDLNGDEFACAQFIDAQPEVKYWVRNIERRPLHSFWLQTSTDKFYPDFVCLLRDGRYLVIEYKSQRDWSNDDSKEKRLLGGLWEERSNGKCLFVMPNGMELQKIRNKITGQA